MKTCFSMEREARFNTKSVKHARKRWKTKESERERGMASESERQQETARDSKRQRETARDNERQSRQNRSVAWCQNRSVAWLWVVSKSLGNMVSKSLGRTPIWGPFGVDFGTHFRNNIPPVIWNREGLYPHISPTDSLPPDPPSQSIKNHLENSSTIITNRTSIARRFPSSALVG